MDEKIAIAKQTASNRKDILDKVEKWMSACEEETWLEDYNTVSSIISCLTGFLFPFMYSDFMQSLFSGLQCQDENRYSASRGAHINLKRAERARIMIQKLPGSNFVMISCLFMFK